MTNAVIFSSDVYLINDILNNPKPQFSYAITPTINDFSNLSKSKKINIIFLDSNVNLKLQNLILSKYKKRTVIVNRKNLKYNSSSTSLLTQKVINQYNEDEIKNKIIVKLQDLGYSIRHQGTHYIADSILEVFKLPDKEIYNLKNDIYPIIAKKYGKSMSNIKSSIHKATEYMYYECDSNLIKEFFHFCDDKKPTTKDVISAIINLI